MKKRLLIITALLLNIMHSRAQTHFPGDPDSALFVTKDINNFWKAFEDFKRDSTTNPFGSQYIDIGGAGVKGFLPNRIQNAGHILEVVKKRKADYEKVKANTLRISDKEKQCRSTFYALKYWYPRAKFPPVYFVIGAYNSGGTSTGDGLLIGAEMQTNIDNIPFIVAHELIHFQQTWGTDNPTLLQQSIMEGSADFIGGLISGGTINEAANAYGSQHTDELCKEFVARMNGTDYQDWLYGTSKKDNRPNDLGYWMGYKIAGQYFTRATDKKQAIDDILNIMDYNAFLRKSGYLDRYLQ